MLVLTACANTSQTSKLFYLPRWLLVPGLTAFPFLALNCPKDPGSFLVLGTSSTFGSATRTHSVGSLIFQTARTVLAAIIGMKRLLASFIFPNPAASTSPASPRQWCHTAKAAPKAAHKPPSGCKVRRSILHAEAS